MKRFIDLRGQIFLDDDLAYSDREPVFAWYDTIVDRFEEWSGEQSWCSKDDFLTAYTGDDSERYLGLMPDWVPEK